MTPQVPQRQLTTMTSQVPPRQLTPAPAPAPAPTTVMTPQVPQRQLTTMTSQVPPRQLTTMTPQSQWYDKDGDAIMSDGDRSTPVYIMLGHGDEELLPPKYRLTVPRGITLVTITECGVLSYDSNIGRLMDVLHDLRTRRPDVIRDPRKHKLYLQRLLGFEIHVYKPGDQFPLLRYSSTSNFSNGYELSGIVDLDTLTDADIGSTYTVTPYSGPGNTMTNDDLIDAYRKSIHPQAHNPYRRVEIQEVFDYFREGVFYFTACRDVDERELRDYPGRLQVVRQFSENQQRTSQNGGNRRKRTMKNRRKTKARRKTTRHFRTFS
jgi:hypothetical protein